MTDLEGLAAALLTQWRADGGKDNAPIAVSAMLDRVLPYRVARRMLGIDSSEDYEALMLHLLAEDEDLVRVEPDDSREMAKATIHSRLPDLDVLQFLRSATLTFNPRSIARLSDVLPMRSAREEAAQPATDPLVDHDVIPLHRAPLPPPAMPVETDAPDFLTTVTFVPPTCWSCHEALPGDRAAKFCPFCGADQREPACTACGAKAERGWKHCAECGAKL